MDFMTIATQIKNRIENAKEGTVFVASDFADITKNSTVGVYLNRLEAQGKIRRIFRGVYEKPIYNKFLQEYISVSPNKVAKALARSFGWTITPCGDTALNVLGLSTQVPASWVYVSDGLYKEYTYDNITIKFKKTTNKEVSNLSQKTALVVQALKALGKEDIDETIIKKLKTDLSKMEKQTMLEEAKPVTAWIYEFIKIICRSDD